jgi:hypothetical protein
LIKIAKWKGFPGLLVLIKSKVKHLELVVEEKEDDIINS